MTTRKKTKSASPTIVTPGSTCYEKTASSIPFTDIVTFGRKLVDELELGQSIDTTGRWMAHYLAEVMARAHTSEGAEKISAERECFEVILQLWQHRASLPGSRRPMNSFEPIFNTLKQLLDHKHLVYFERTEDRLDPDSENWLELATGLDHAARDLIRWCIAMASTEAVNKDGTWLEDETARALDDGSDLKAARLLIEDTKIYIGIKEKLTEWKTKELTEIRDRLNALLSVSEDLRDQIDAALSDTPRKG